MSAPLSLVILGVALVLASPLLLRVSLTGLVYGTYRWPIAALVFLAFLVALAGGVVLVVLGVAGAP